MTIRIFTLGLFAMLCLVAPQPSFAESGRGDHRGGAAREQAQERRSERNGGHNEDRQENHIAPVNRAELRDELMKLPPEQRREKIEQMKQQLNEGRAQKLEERKAAFQQKWEGASPEQRVKFCGNVQQKCASGERGAEFACAVARNKCEGQ